MSQIQLGHNRHIGSVEDGRIFERLVFTFRGGNEHQAKVLTEIKAGGADQISNIFDEKKIQIFERPAFKRSLDHAGIQMADGAGGNLLYHSPGPFQPCSVVLGCQISYEGGYAEPLPKIC